MQRQLGPGDSLVRPPICTDNRQGDTEREDDQEHHRDDSQSGPFEGLPTGFIEVESSGSAFSNNGTLAKSTECKALIDPQRGKSLSGRDRYGPRPHKVFDQILFLPNDDCGGDGTHREFSG
jgi:hypothetical protein